MLDLPIREEYSVRLLAILSFQKMRRRNVTRCDAISRPFNPFHEITFQL